MSDSSLMHFVIDHSLTQKSDQAMDAKDRYRIVRYTLPPPIPPGQQFIPLDYILHFFTDRYTIYEAHYLLEMLSLSVKGKIRVAYWDPQEGANGFVNDFSRLLNAAYNIRNEPPPKLSPDEPDRETETRTSWAEISHLLPETNNLIPEIDPWHYLQIIFEKYDLSHLLNLIQHWGLTTFRDTEIPWNITKNHFTDDLIMNLILDCCHQIYVRNSKKEPLPDVLGKLYMFQK